MAPPGGENGMTSFPVIEKRPIPPKPLQVGVSFRLNTNRKSLVGFQYSINIKVNKTTIQVDVVI